MVREQAAANYSAKGQRVNILDSVGQMSLGNYSILPGEHESHHRQHANERVRLCTNKTLLTNTGGGSLILAMVSTSVTLTGNSQHS